MVRVAGPAMDIMSATLTIDAPMEAPIVVHALSTNIRDMIGPVVVSARGATILDTTGSADAIGGQINFSATKGKVNLDGDEVNIKMKAQEFDGSMIVESGSRLTLLIPQSFRTSFTAHLVNPEGFSCGGAFCSKINKERRDTYVFHGDSYDPAMPPPITLFSADKLAIDTVN